MICTLQPFDNQPLKIASAAEAIIFFVGDPSLLKPTAAISRATKWTFEGFRGNRFKILK